MKIKCYSMLTLKKDEILEFLPSAHISGPVSRGDILKDIEQKINVILIIDGKFQQSLATSPSEIMDALRSGIRVYGSSSMGALRAVELESYGMIGHGKVFDLIKADRFFRDDFLGQFFEPELEMGQTYAFIDFYFNLQTLFNLKKISRRQLNGILKKYADLHFADRTPNALVNDCSKLLYFDDDLLNLIRSAAAGAGSQKRRDALSLLRFVKEDLLRIAGQNADIEKSLKRRRRNAILP